MRRTIEMFARRRCWFVACRKSMLLRVCGKRARAMAAVGVEIFLDEINVRVAAHVRAGASVADRFD
ncbi:hypothetical protein CA830_42360, partial [Burkholderia multivorans]